MKSIIVGTAGHIDHGKTALVRALTGIDADRLPEEKRRGITIDIGFAELDLGEVRIGFVDVPGHERFVKNMLAGAHGIDAVALIIAADESVMPQTREHFDICRLLGVSKGLIILTKKDLVDAELLQLARAEAEDLVKGSFLEGARIVDLSSRTGDGIDEVKQALRELGADVPERSSDYIARLPIDRSFTMKGFGAVVTGTLIAGAIREGDDLDLLPIDTRVRVRGVQVHGSAVKQAVAGQRTAINLAGIESAAIERGMILVQPGRLRTTQIVDASITVLPDAPRALRSRQRVRVHLGAAEVLARVRVLESEGEIKPGARGFAQLRFESPIVAVLGDRFILRAYSPQMTIGGGVILDPFASKHRSRELSSARERLTLLAGGDHSQQLAQYIIGEGRLGITKSELAARTAWRDEVIESALQPAAIAKSTVRLETTLLGREVYDGLKSAIVREIESHHKREPLARGLPKEILHDRFFAGASTEVFREAIAQMEKDGAFTSEKEIVKLRDHARELSAEDTKAKDKLEAAYRNAGVAPPALADAFKNAGLDNTRGRKILQLILDSGSLVKVHGDMLFHREALDALIQKLRARAVTQPDRSIDVGAFKELAGISRKYAIPLLEYFDRQRVTRREGDRRTVL
ncbi:MAG TPA: selenocysteine-specific translation elongation factor [Pyrinomonadaceae bacterium]|nr:selenocysteine-specific translation elongation factor [Pyrinomonadaceae bacterium]